MRLSLQTKVSIFVTLIILIISAFSTYLFTTQHGRSKERGLIIRGTALSYSLSKAAEEGLVKEDLSLIKKASYIIQAPDVTLAEVYSNIWEAVDAYPLGSLKSAPHPEAVEHFKREPTPFHVKIPDGYDFYSPILFKAFEDSPPATIGYVRITLSSAAFQKEMRTIAVINIAVSLLITLFAVISLNLLIRRIVIRPVMALHDSITQFKDGCLPEDLGAAGRSTDEIRELAGGIQPDVQNGQGERSQARRIRPADPVAL